MHTERGQANDSAPLPTAVLQVPGGGEHRLGHPWASPASAYRTSKPRSHRGCGGAGRRRQRARAAGKCSARIPGGGGQQDGGGVRRAVWTGGAGPPHTATLMPHLAVTGLFGGTRPRPYENPAPWPAIHSPVAPCNGWDNVAPAWPSASGPGLGSEQFAPWGGRVRRWTPAAYACQSSALTRPGAGGATQLDGQLDVAISHFSAAAKRMRANGCDAVSYAQCLCSVLGSPVLVDAAPSRFGGGLREPIVWARFSGRRRRKRRSGSTSADAMRSKHRYVGARDARIRTERCAALCG